ncbi:MAG: response regulator [Alphaproteobacteria bacterium]|nr:response regulator [Alphaproteobacteria bacterium]
MTVPAPHILVVDDEADLRDTVCDYLRLYGMRASAAEDGAAMRRALAGDPVDLVVLDVKMPGEGGLLLARWLREHHRIGIVMATTMGDLVDRVVGLEVGADDYVAKPLDLRELTARIKAVLRRRGRAGPAAIETHAVGFGRFRFDAAAHRLLDERGEAVAMTRMETDLLAAFAANPDRVLSRERLLDLAHGKEVEPFDRSIDMRIARIRQKIEPDPSKPSVIRTVRGAGYIFTPTTASLPS